MKIGFFCKIWTTYPVNRIVKIFISWHTIKYICFNFSLSFTSSSVYGCFSYMYVCSPCECLLPSEVKRGHQILWDWSYWQLEVTTWVLETELMSSARAASDLKCLNRLSSPGCNIFKKHIWCIKFFNFQGSVITQSNSWVTFIHCHDGFVCLTSTQASSDSILITCRIATISNVHLKKKSSRLEMGEITHACAHTHTHAHTHSYNLTVVL